MRDARTAGVRQGREHFDGVDRALGQHEQVHLVLNANLRHQLGTGEPLEIPE
jgi:hypothetical protein